MFYKFYKPGKVQILRWLKNPNCYMRKHGANGIYVDAGETNAFQTAMVVGIKAERVLYTYNKSECLDASNVEYLDTCNKAECFNIENKVEYLNASNKWGKAECLNTSDAVECLNASVNVEYLDVDGRVECLNTENKVECWNASVNVEYLDVDGRV